jgi:N-acetylmuramoyl-L-alanine amidase
MPSILAEVGFLSNAREEQLLKRPDHRQRLAEALYQGVSRYAQSLSHFQVAQRTSVD